MKLPKGLKVKWSTTPTTFDQKGCDGLFIQEMTVKWWVSAKLLWKFLKGYEAKVMRGHRFIFKLPIFILFVYLIIMGKNGKNKLIKDFIIGG